MMMTRTEEQFAQDARDKCGDPGTTPVEHLRHVVAAFQDQPDSDMVVTASYNVYGDGVTTGMTWGDLRAILGMLDMLPTGTEAHPTAGGPRLHTMQMAGAFSDRLADMMSPYHQPTAPQPVRDAYEHGTIVPRGPHYTRLVKASAEVLYAFSEHAETLINSGAASDAEVRGARKWLKDMSDRSL